MRLGAAAPAPMLQVYDTVLRVETPGVHASPEMQQWLSDEASKPSKRWIQDVIHRRREEANIRLKTDEFILLPDVTSPPKHRLFQWQQAARARLPRSCLPVGAARAGPSEARAGSNDSRPEARPGACLTATDSNNAWQRPRQARGECDPRHWLAIVTDPALRSIRDLRGEHLGMLRALEWQCTEAMLREHPTLRREDVMIFANYPPSVYQLHFHVCVPFKTQTPYDAFRIHPLHTIINSLTVSPTFYRDSSFRVPVQRGSDLCQILARWDMDKEDETEFIHASKARERRTLREPPGHREEEAEVCFVLDL